MERGYKWYRVMVLKRDSELKRHLPETRSFTRQALSAMLDKYPKIIVKPSHGSGGFGVMQISAERNGRYKKHLNQRVETVTGTEKLYSAVKRSMSKRPYIIQQRIPLAEVNRRPFDVRVMVQRKKEGEWNVTGVLAKVAGPGYIVTNIMRSGGKVLPIKTAISRSNILLPPESILQQLNAIALHIAQRLGPAYPKQRVFGLDMGIDRNGRVWIIETNFTPMVSLFRQLKDKTMYRTILEYKKSLS